MIKGWIKKKITNLEKLKTEDDSLRRFKNILENKKLEQIICSFRVSFK